MSHSIKVSAVVTRQLDGQPDLTQRVTSMTFLMPCDGTTTAWHYSPVTVPVEAMTFELQGPNVASLVAQAREEGRQEILDKLTSMEGAFQDLFGEHPDLRITDEDW